ncbi:MAG TPA: TlpA disulfide reductase family protein [Bacteroidia bacterium]|jgi:thiol-disulfide isomerase/thioredoxin
MSFKNKLFRSGTALVVSLLFFVNVSFAQSPSLKKGLWEAELTLNDSTNLRFYFEILSHKDKYSVVFINAKERISTDLITITKDSVFVKMPVFDSEFKLSRFFDFPDILKGEWVNHARKDKNVIPFSAGFHGPFVQQFDSIDWKTPEGRWESTFNQATKDSSKALGIFSQDQDNSIHGTFLTETGDYRFLSGMSYPNNTFYLSCFDGSHAFLFTGKTKGDSIVNGHFYSGAHHHEPWLAVRNDKFQLRNPDSLTYLKPGYSKINFSFNNLEGKTVSLSDPKYKGKVVIVQLMGSWCPNCMDETKFLASFYDQYKTKGLEVVALAFERTADFSKAVQNVTRLKNRFAANYDFLITMKTGKDQASAALPMLNEVMAFPTTIYIDKKGVVRKIYTGFNGPATGAAYTQFEEETTRFIEKLLQE